MSPVDFNRMTLSEFVRESNRIEGILRDPFDAELDAHDDFLLRSSISIPTLQKFVSIVAPGKRLRDRQSMDVQVGNHIAPRGGSNIRSELESLLMRANTGIHPWKIHLEYETLHPFMDGNGRSGRALWLWMMSQSGQLNRALKLGFLHSFYYQTLDNIGR